MTNDLMQFTSLAEMRDAVLEAPRLTPEGHKKEYELLLRAIEAMRQGRSFAFDDGFNLNADAFYEIAEQGERAFAAGSLRLPYPVFAGLTKLTLHGEPELAIVMAEEVPQAEHGLSTDDLVLCVYAVWPLRWPDEGAVVFNRISRTLFIASVEGFAVQESVEPPINEFETEMLQTPLATLFVMLTVLGDDGVAIRRTSPVKVNAARAQRGRPLIPPMWTVSGGDLIELCATTIKPKQPRRRGARRRSPSAGRAWPARPSAAAVRRDGSPGSASAASASCSSISRGSANSTRSNPDRRGPACAAVIISLSSPIRRSRRELACVVVAAVVHRSPQHLSRMSSGPQSDQGRLAALNISQSELSTWRPDLLLPAARTTTN